MNPETAPVGLSKDANHIYCAKYPDEPTRVLPGVTGVLRALDKPAIVPWAQRITAEAAVDNRDKIEEWVQLGGRDGAVELLRNSATRKRDEAADIGSQVHALADALVKGQPVAIAEEIAPFVYAYQAWIEAFQPTFLAVEEMVCGDGYAGTLDSIAVIGGSTWLLDIKTSAKGPFRETALQLAAYGNAQFIGRMHDTNKYEIPPIEQYGVIKVRPEGAELVPFDVREDTYQVFRNVLEVSRWFKGPATTVVQQPVGPALLHFPEPVPQRRTA